MGISLFSRSTSIVPETNVAEPTLAELTLRVTKLAEVIAAQARTIAELRALVITPALVAPSAHTTADTVPAYAPAATIGDCGNSPRKLMGYIGRAVLAANGRSESKPDTAHLAVRRALETRDEFASLRLAGDVCADADMLRWLAEPADAGMPESRYAVILAGAATAEELLEMGA